MKRKRGIMIILETIIMIALTIISVLMTALALVGTFVIGKDVLQELDLRKNVDLLPMT